jgi:predicted nucleic acid-binding protein
MGDVTIGGATAETQGRAAPIAYLDTNLVSALARKDQPDEVDALFELVDLMHENRIALVTSTVTEEEIEAVPEEHRAAHEGVYALLRKIPSVDEQMVWPTILTNRGGSRLAGPAFVKEADLGTLEEILRDVNDARHVFQALKNGATYFVTADKRTILSRAGKIESAFPIRVLAPSQLVAELTAES